MNTSTDSASQAPPAAVLLGRSISKIYRLGDVEVHALRGVSLDLRAGEFVVLLGASGSGKSTLLNILGGLDVPTSGEVLYRDHVLTTATDRELTRYRREHVGFVFQFFNLLPSLTALENVELVTEIAENPIPAAEALGMVGLAGRLRHFPAQLSGGEQQRVADRAGAREAPGCPAVRRAHGIARLPDWQGRSRGPRARESRARDADGGHHAQRRDRRDGRSSPANQQRRDRRRQAQRDAAVAVGVVVVSPLHRALLRDLWHLRGQVLAAALVTACGIAAFVTMLSAYRSLERARDDYYAEYRFADVFAQLQRAPVALGADIGRIPGVAAVDLRVVKEVNLNVPGLAEPAAGRLISLPSSRRPALNDLFVRRGRRPDPGRSDEVVASETFAQANALGVGSRVGAILNGRWKELTIVGLALSPEYIYEVAPGMIFPDNRRFGVLWMDHEAVAAAFDMKGAFNDVSVRIARGASLEGVEEAIDRVLAPYGGLRAYGRSEQTSNRFLNDELTEIEVQATYVPAIFLAVAAFLIYTLLSRLVATERSQIALLKAFGYANVRIGLHFAEFALVVVAAGLIVGIGLGAYFGGGLIGIYRDYFHFPSLRFRLPWPVAVTAALIALGSALVASLTSVRRAAKLPPAEAMRPEPPKSFRAGRWESAGAFQHIGPTGRVILRNIARRPWRAGLSIVGIAAAVATVVAGRFAFDAVDDLVAAHFGAVQREDATVNLRVAGSAAAIRAIAHLPGVLRVEPFRTLPVRLTFEHRHKRAAIPRNPGRRGSRAARRRAAPADRRAARRPRAHAQAGRTARRACRRRRHRRATRGSPPGVRGADREVVRRAARHRRVHGCTRSFPRVAGRRPGVRCVHPGRPIA